MSFHFELSASSYSSSDEERYSFTAEEGKEEEKYEQIRDEAEKKEFLLQYQLGFASSTTQNETQNEAESASISCAPNIGKYNDSNGSSDDEDISDWEEGIEEEEGALEQKQLSMGMAKEITVNLLDQSKEDGIESARNKMKRHTPRVRHKLTNLPPETTQLVRNLHQAHLLTLTARAVHSFQQLLKLRECKLLLHIASSLIPLQFHIEQKQRYRHHVVPTYQQLCNFTHWYFTWIATLQQRLDNNRSRNISMGAPSPSSYSSNDRMHQDIFYTTNSSYQYNDNCSLCCSSDNVPSLHHRIRTILYYLASCCNDDDPTNSNTVVTINAKEKLYLYIFLCHSCLHWSGVRFVNSFSPIELELTCNHPLFTVDMEAKHYNNHKYQTLQQFHPSLVATAQPNSTSSSHRSWEKSFNHDYTEVIDLSQEGSETEDMKQPAKRKQKNNNGHLNNEDSLSESIVSLLSYCYNLNTAQSTRKKGITIPNVKNPSDMQCHGKYTGGDQYAWVEVLCLEENGASQNLRWIHVDNEYEIIDQPKQVEHILAAKGKKNMSINIAGGKRSLKLRADINTNPGEGNSSKRRNRRGSMKKVSDGNYLSTQQLQSSQARNIRFPRTSDNIHKSKQLVSYVLAVEYRKAIGQGLNHSEDPSSKKRSLLPGIHLTDVTPRYASAWSKTLKLRGATNRDLVGLAHRSSSSSHHSHSFLWWEGILQKLNGGFENLSPSFPAKKIKSKSIINTVQLHENEQNGVIIIDELPQEIKAKDRSSIRTITSKHKVPETYEGTRDNDQLLQEDFFMEQNEFQEAAHREAIPTSKSSFKNHPLYVIPSVLKESEVLTPDAKSQICGMFKGELVYKRCSVSPAYSEKKWLYERRKVRETEINTPAKVVAPKRTIKRTKAFKALSTYGIKSDDTEAQQLGALNSMEIFDDAGKVRLYGIWQTDPWTPKYISLNDDIPRNEYGNVEKAMLNPGLEHIKEPRMSLVAKKLGIPYAPCLVGFEGPLRTPSIQGIVVHHQNVNLLREAYVELESHNVEKEYQKKQKVIFLRWKRLIVGMQTKDRLEKEYGGHKRSCSKI